MSDDGTAAGGQFSDLGATRMQRVNQVCNRFEAAWRSGDRPRLAEYLASAPSQEQPVLARMLIELDIDYRRMHGETPRPEDYRKDLPFEATWLDALVRGALDATIAESPAAQETSGEFSLRQGPSKANAQEVLPRVLGDYLLLERIGGGGMGVVYKAEHQRMRRIVAIKLIRPEHANAAQSQQRFQREVEAAARLHHPYIVTAYDARVEQGAWCLITEFVSGQDLARIVQESGPLSLSQALRCICQTAEALEYAHKQGVVHRDIKPSNLLLDSSGNIKVLDMGLARLQDLESDSEETRAAARLTQTGYVVGTVDFMSPEQARNSAQADARSDIYSLGCTLYYLLTGKAAYRGTTVMETLLAHREQPIPLLSSIRTDSPPKLDQVLKRLLAKQPEARHQSMSEVLVALREVVNSMDVNSGPTRTRPARLPKFLQRGIVITGLGVLLLGLLWAGYSWWQSEPNGRPQAERSSDPALAQSSPESSVVKELPTFNPAEATQEQVAAAQALGVPLEITNDLQMRLRLVPGSRLQIADRTVTVPEPFYMATTEVTVAQFRQFVEATHHETEPERATGWGLRDGNWVMAEGFHWKNLGEHSRADDLPAVNITWNDAQAFCTWLSAQPNAGGRYRLPTENEWELACRAGSTATWFFGDDRNRLGEYAWYEGNSGKRLQRVAQRSPNAFGLYDMLGNESEWCSDLFTPGDISRTQRGGSFSHRAEEVTCSARWSDAPTSPSHGAFRVVRDLKAD